MLWTKNLHGLRQEKKKQNRENTFRTMNHHDEEVTRRMKEGLN
jgi:hypothetical protein